MFRGRGDGSEFSGGVFVVYVVVSEFSGWAVGWVEVCSGLSGGRVAGLRCCCFLFVGALGRTGR